MTGTIATFPRKLLCVGAVASALLASPVLAQDGVTAQTKAADQDTTTGIEDVIVTAERTESRLQNTPIAVTAFNGASLRAQGVTNLLDVATFTPNLSIGSRSGAGTNSGGIAIRGIGVDGGSQAAVGVYIDDVYFPAAAGNLLNLFDVQRIEVLRGPQGTLFGRNTIGGALQYITVKPGREFEGFIDGIYGSDNRRAIQGAVNLPISDTLAVRFGVSYNDTGGYVSDLLKNIDRGAVRNTQARLQVRWDPTDRLTVDLKAEGFNERANGRAVEVAGFNNNAQFVGIAVLSGLPKNPLTDAVLSRKNWEFPGYNDPEFARARYREGQAVVAYDLTDNLTLKSITAYSKTRTRRSADLDNSPVSILQATGGPVDTKLFTQELQASGRILQERVRWTVGYYYFNSEETTISSIIKIGLGAPMKSGGDAFIKRVSHAVYGQATYNFTDKLSSLLGLRYSSEKTDARNLTSTQFRTDANFTDFSPAIGLNFQANANTLYYLKASKGFRAGGATPTTAVATGFVLFGPETAWTYEAGARWELMDRRLRVNPTIFYTDWKNIQFNALVPTPTTIVQSTQNAGNARIKGAELDSQFVATDRLLLTATVSLLDGEYTAISPSVTRLVYLKGFPGAATPLPNLSLSSDLQRAPKVKATLGGRYTYPLAHGGRLVGNVDYSYTAKQRSAVTNSDFIQMPAYSLVNARLQYDASNRSWSVAVFVNNLTDEHYLIGGVNFAEAYTTGTTENDPGRPRQFGVNLRFNL